MTRLVYTVAEAADELRISPASVRRLIARGHLATIPNLGRSVRIAGVELARFTTSPGYPDPTGEAAPAPLGSTSPVEFRAEGAAPGVHLRAVAS